MKSIPSITDEQIRLCKLLVNAQAYTQTIRPIVEKYENEIISKHQFMTEAKTYKIPQENGSTITREVPAEPATRENLFRLSNFDFATFEDERQSACKAAKLTVKEPAHCPLLVAENLERQAQRAFMDAMQPITRLSVDDILCSANGMENYAKMTELCIKAVFTWCKDHGQTITVENSIIKPAAA